MLILVFAFAYASIVNTADEFAVNSGQYTIPTYATEAIIVG
jgi:hypothetical protein